MQRARAGLMRWTRRPYGYRLDDNGRIVADEHEAAVLRSVVDRLLQGASLASLVRELNANGERTSVGQPWTVTGLRRVVLNPRLSGRVHYRGEDVGPGDWPVILDGDMQERLSALLRSPSRRQQVSTERKYLLSGTLRCGRCGERMFASPAGSGAGRYMAYRCRTPHLMRRLDLVDELVSRTVIARLSQPDAASLLVPDVDLDALCREASELRQRRDELAALLADGLLSPIAVREQAAALTARLKDIDVRGSAASDSSPAAALAAADDVQHVWDTLGVNARRQIVDELMTVTLLPAGKGARFQPEHVRVEWRVAQA